jgi:tRNA(Glu) U13 pseudouridine synthase TruD
MRDLAVKAATFTIAGTKHRHAVTPINDKHLTEAQKSQTENFMWRFIGYFALESRLLLNFCFSLTLCT